MGFQEVLHAAARAAAREGHRLVLAVDGLDRAAEGAALPLALPTSLPDNAYVIATVREGVPLHARQERHGHVRIDPTDEATLDDVRRHVAEVLAADDVLRGRVEAKLPVDRFQDELTRWCGGVWIFLRHVPAEVRAGLREPDALAALPEGLWAYYSETLDELMDEGDVVPVLSVPACAPEPLTLDAVVALSGAPDPRALVSGRLRAFADDRGGRFAPLHDSARDYLLGVRPDGGMTGDETRLDLLATTATTTRRRIADRYLAALDRDPAGLGGLEEGYGLRNLAGHLAELDAVEELHGLLTAPRDGSTAWFRAHEAHGTFTDCRASPALGRRLAAEATDAELAEGGRARPIGREIRYALMDGSVESVVTGVRPGLLRALVEGRVWRWRPRAAPARVRAVENYAARVELVAALARARWDEEPCLDPDHAARALALISPLLSGRAHRTAALLAPLLSEGDRARLVADLLPVDGSRDRADVLVALAPALTPDEAERAVAEALELPDQARALAGLIPHVPARVLPALHPVVARYSEPFGYRQLARRALVLRLAAERLEPAWVAADLAHELTSLGVQADLGGPEHVRALVPLVDGPAVAAALDVALDHVDRSDEPDVPDVPVLSALAEFLHGPAVTRALGLARAVGRNRPVGLRAQPHWARASALAAVLRAVPEACRSAVVAEALRAAQAR
ncbi:hypothetical protein Q5530_13085 [Saccharothrix sp. BKS2]|uniref:hypothetical protein n=1 Tax=Saccharothrix sp. BKS2 TaxID=3064400 RepID=UPI0039E9A1D0